MKNNLPKKCYWCGKSLTKESTKREHVPPFSFFPKGYRENLMTIPSCEEHNNNFSQLDEKFQFLIKSFRTNYVAENDLLDRVIRGLRRKEKENFVKELEQKTKFGEINGKPHLFLELNKNEPELFIEKIIRGIYFYHKEKPAKGIIQSFSKRFINENVDVFASIDFLKKDLNPQILTIGDYNNPQVFKYQYLDSFGVFAIFMQFYEEAEFIGWVFPENFTFD
ncbi:HNH endonuclease [Polaribacter sp. 11A2H]|uniref:HNH endonuclease n=1 Tax=Polaribacter sp. 11A2H TaxID=2687290 RepID=UPI001408757B|nr:HNH endonuclease [Polaribacter sp. 11A2H]